MPGVHDSRGPGRFHECWNSRNRYDCSPTEVRPTPLFDNAREFKRTQKVHNFRLGLLQVHLTMQVQVQVQVYKYGSSSTAQHSTKQQSTAQHRTAQHRTAQFSTVQHTSAQRSTAQHSYSTAHAQRRTAPHRTTQHALRLVIALVFLMLLSCLIDNFVSFS